MEVESGGRDAERGDGVESARGGGVDADYGGHGVGWRGAGAGSQAEKRWMRDEGGGNGDGGGVLSSNKAMPCEQRAVG